MLGFYPLSVNAISSLPISLVNLLYAISSVLAEIQNTLLKKVYLDSGAQLLETIYITLGVHKKLNSYTELTTFVYEQISNIVIINLQLLIDVTLSALYTPMLHLESSISLKSECYPILDIDNNTMGSPGGIPVDGFYPPNNVIFIVAYETDEQITKQVVLSVGNFTEAVYDDEILDVTLNGSTADVTLKLPYTISSMNSVFYLNKILTPVPVAYNYILNFDLNIDSLSLNNFSLPGYANVLLILEGDKVYATNELYKVLVGRVINNTRMELLDLTITLTNDILIRALCLLNLIPTPGYYLTIEQTRLVDNRDVTESIELTYANKEAEPMVTYLILEVNGIYVNYKIMILPDFSTVKNAILETLRK